jgi:prophage regulatory protein
MLINNSFTSPNLESNSIQVRLIRKKEVLFRTGLTSSSLYRLMIQGDFPCSITISERSVAWNESDIIRWIDNRINLSAIA